jgi:hypothetical protein
MRLQYGECPCGGVYEARTVEVRIPVEGKPLVMKDMPQGACPNCGSRVYKLEVLERIEALMKSGLTASQLLEPARESENQESAIRATG